MRDYDPDLGLSYGRNSPTQAIISLMRNSDFGSFCASTVEKKMAKRDPAFPGRERLAKLMEIKSLY